MARSRRYVRNQSSRFWNPGSPPISSSVSTCTANSGIEPDHRADAQRDAATVDVHLVVVETVLLVPQPRAAEGVHGVGDVHEVLEELGGDVLRAGIEARQLQGHGEHRGAVERHPGGAVRLLQMAAVGQRPRAVEDADVVQPQEAAREQVLAAGVLAIDPPGEIDQAASGTRWRETAGRAGPAARSSCRPASRPRHGPAD